MTAKRYNPDDPAIQGRKVVLASDYDSMQLDFTNTRTDRQEQTSANLRQAQKIAGLESELSSMRSLALALDSDVSLDERMQAAGMFTVAQILAGKPIDAFIRHAGVTDLKTFGKWLEMKRAQFVKMQARFELADRENDELYEWAFSHAAVFSEVMINFRYALQLTPPATEPDEPSASKARSRLH